MAEQRPPYSIINVIKSGFAQPQRLASALTALVPIFLVLGRSPADIAVSIVAVLFFADSTIRREWSWTRNSFMMGILLLWAYSVLRACFMPEAISNVFAALVWVRYILFAASISVWMRMDEKGCLWLFLISLTAALFLSFDAIFQYVTGFDIISRPLLGGRLTSIYNHPIVGMTIANLFVLPLFWLLQEKHAKYSILFGGICITAILLSGERMAFLFATAVMLPWLFFLLRAHRKFWPLAIAGIGLFVALIALRPDILNRQVHSTSEVIADIAVSPYGLAWTSALRVGEAHPFFGVGMRQFRYECLDEHYGPLENPISHYPRCYVHPHNIYLEWFSENGLIGVGGFITCIIILFIGLKRQLAIEPGNMILWGVAFVLGVRLLPLFASTSFFNNWAAIPFWLYVGLALQKERKHHFIWGNTA